MAETVDLYLDLLQKSLCDAVYGENRWQRWITNLIQRVSHPYATRHGALAWPLRAHSMIGPKRLSHLRYLVETTIKDGTPGDYIETGVWRGGACIMMRAVLAAHQVNDRRVFCADSFEGLPKPDAKYRQDRHDRLFRFSELAISEDEVRRNFSAYNLLDDQVVFLKGFFRDTLPTLNGHRFSLIRLDGDMYESTMDALTHLYDRLSQNGFVIVDDYGALKCCAEAVHDFLGMKGFSPQIHRIDDSAVWWQKTNKITS